MATNVCSSSFLAPGLIAFANRGAISAVATMPAARAWAGRGGAADAEAHIAQWLAPATDDRALRALVVIVGVGMALSGVAVVCHQMLLWQQDGYWNPIPFGVLWVALGGAAPDLVDMHGIGGIKVWLLGQPLREILLLVGAAFSWIGIEGISRTPPKI